MPKGGDTVHGDAVAGANQTNTVVGVSRVAGEYQGIAPDLKIWTVLYSSLTDRFYPQVVSDRTGDPTNQANGTFKGGAALVGKPGAVFELSAIVADADASELLEKKISEWENDEEPGTEGWPFRISGTV